jgi:outer membrane biosynthesis protein TonB
MIKVSRMRSSIYFSLLALSSVSLAACSGEPAADSAVTETKMDSVDAIQGTISDEMIVTDDSSDQAPIADASEAPEEPVKGSAKPDKKEAAKPKPAPKPAEPVKPAPKPPADESPAE